MKQRVEGERLPLAEVESAAAPGHTLTGHLGGISGVALGCVESDSHRWLSVLYGVEQFFSLHLGQKLQYL